MGEKTLNIPLTYGDDEVVHYGHRFLTPFDADAERYLTNRERGGRIRILEASIVALNVVNVGIYLGEWTGVTVSGVITILWSRVVMLACTPPRFPSCCDRSPGTRTTTANLEDAAARSTRLEPPERTGSGVVLHS